MIVNSELSFSFPSLISLLLLDKRMCTHADKNKGKHSPWLLSRGKEEGIELKRKKKLNKMGIQPYVHGRTIMNMPGIFHITTRTDHYLTPSQLHNNGISGKLKLEIILGSEGYRISSFFPAIWNQSKDNKYVTVLQSWLSSPFPSRTWHHQLPTTPYKWSRMLGVL